MGKAIEFGPDPDEQYEVVPITPAGRALPCGCTNRGDGACTLGGTLLPWCCPVCTGHLRADGSCLNECGTPRARAFRTAAD